MTLTGELSWQRLISSSRYGWCPPKFKWFTWPNHANFRDGLPSVS